MHAVIESQYRAALRMLRQAVARCPESLWNSPGNGEGTIYENRTWRIAYHVLFYTDLYLSPSEREFAPWDRGIPNANFMNVPIEEEHNTVDEILEYLGMIDDRLHEAIAAVPLDEPTSGFEWIPFSRFELHLYTIRHLQHHTGQLFERLRSNGMSDLGWIGMG